MSVTRVTSQDDLLFDNDFQKAKDWYAGICGRTLRKHYPWNNWLVDIKLDATGGLAYIREPSISTKYGMAVHLTESVPALEYEVMKAGGEILERFNLSRSNDNADGVASLKRNIMGEAITAKDGEA